MAEVRQAVLLAGGLAKRLGSITSVTNKHLLPVYDKPMIYHGLELLRRLGVKNVTIVLGGNSVGDIVNLVKDGEAFGLHVTYVYQREPKGISQAILLAEKTLNPGKFLVLLGDNIFDNIDSIKGDIDEFFNPVTFMFEEDSSLVVLYQSDEPQNYGQPLFNKYGDVVGFAEKLHKPLHNIIVVGLYGLSDNVFGIIRNQKPSERNEYEITDTLNEYIRNMLVAAYTGFWTDCGTPEGLIEASTWFRKEAGK